MRFGQHPLRLTVDRSDACWIVLTLVWLASVFFPAHYFGTMVAMRFGSGEFGLFWDGNPDMRNSYIFNGAHWPPADSDHFAGADWFEYAGWGFQFYGCFSPWQSYGEPLTVRLFVSRLGFRLPTVRLNSEGSSVVVPLGSLLMTLVMGSLVYRLCLRNHRAGCCSKCGYCLTGLQSNRCPECGSMIKYGEFASRRIHQEDSARVDAVS